MNRAIAIMIKKCHSLAQWKPPITHRTANCQSHTKELTVI